MSEVVREDFIIRVVPSLDGCPVLVFDNIMFVEDTGSAELNDLAIEAAIRALNPPK